MVVNKCLTKTGYKKWVQTNQAEIIEVTLCMHITNTQFAFVKDGR